MNITTQLKNYYTALTTLTFIKTFIITQGSMLISGLWGIVWFKEINGCYNTSLWLISASLTVAGIILLGYEHDK